jgi:apoptosis-inducing factor 3
MSASASELKGPDLRAGIDAGTLPEGGMLLGHADGEAVLLARHGGEVFAVEATCTHYGGPLAEGMLVGDTVRCPWHHACFSLRNGHALKAPALKPLGCFAVETQAGKLVVLGRKQPEPEVRHPVVGVQSIVIVGGGPAGHAAAETLRNEGYAGKLTLISADHSPPVDRPNLSKDYLAGNAPEEWLPLRPPEFFAEHAIELVLGHRVRAVDPHGKRLSTEDGREFTFDRLLLATGADPIKLTIPGGHLSHVHYLRTLAHSRAIIAALGNAKKAVVLGASFIALEVAASLRTRGLEVAVVGPDAVPLERVLGTEVGKFVRSLHEEHGVTFHLGQTATAIEAQHVVLTDGQTLPADLVVAGIGVKPAVGLAEWAGLATDRGIVVNEYLETSTPGVFAAGDNARFPDPRGDGKLRIEHFVVAERQGQVAAKNMLGRGVPYADVPFFWSAHYDVTITYVGHAEKWDRVEIEGSLAARDAKITYYQGQKQLAVATLGRDAANLAAEVELERTR